ncbi:MAG: DUF6514 family protein [Oscillospiraceae bacterium]
MDKLKCDVLRIDQINADEILQYYRITLYFEGFKSSQDKLLCGSADIYSTKSEALQLRKLLLENDAHPIHLRDIAHDYRFNFRANI